MYLFCKFFFLLCLLLSFCYNGSSPKADLFLFFYKSAERKKESE